MEERVELTVRKEKLHYFKIIKILTIAALLCATQQLYDFVLEEDIDSQELYLLT
jgi:hypothetical protein